MTKKFYVVPTRMHYDIYEVWDFNSAPVFVCSCAKEAAAINIINALKLQCIEHGSAYGQTTYKVRARPTKEHTIHSVTV